MKAFSTALTLKNPVLTFETIKGKRIRFKYRQHSKGIGPWVWNAGRQQNEDKMFVSYIRCTEH
ncbi:hypothetical protein SOVF_094110 [Spinacia oleracea]|nr:hypothetical protein SOVF_094110 [Spinacia oleracea]